jgi:hypothetical protein
MAGIDCLHSHQFISQRLGLVAPFYLGGFKLGAHHVSFVALLPARSPLHRQAFGKICHCRQTTAQLTRMLSTLGLHLFLKVLLNSTL